MWGVVSFQVSHGSTRENRGGFCTRGEFTEALEKQEMKSLWGEKFASGGSLYGVGILNLN